MAEAKRDPDERDLDGQDRVSLAPLDAETALRALLAVDPEDEPASSGDGEESPTPAP